MSRITRRAVALACAILPVTGCSRPDAAPSPKPAVAQSIGKPSGVITWLPSAGTEKPVPGVDRAALYYEGPGFVIWSDFDGGSSAISSDKAQGFACRGHLQAHDGRRVEFRCQTDDGKTGPVTIGESSRDLANGNLFLITLDGERLRVSQLKRDLGNVQFTPEKLQAFARQDPEVVGFFTQSATPK